MVQIFRVYRKLNGGGLCGVNQIGSSHDAFDMVISPPTRPYIIFNHYYNSISIVIPTEWLLGGRMHVISEATSKSRYKLA